MGNGMNSDEAIESLMKSIENKDTIMIVLRKDHGKRKRKSDFTSGRSVESGTWLHDSYQQIQAFLTRVVVLHHLFVQDALFMEHYPFFFRNYHRTQVRTRCICS